MLLVGVTVAVASPVPQQVSAAAALPAHTSKFVPVGPVRLADTRPDKGAYGFTRPVPSVFRVKVAGRLGVPANATEVVVNVTAMTTRGAGRAAVYGAGDPVPTSANIVADVKGQSVSNLVHVHLSAIGAIDIRRTVGMDVAVDLQGYYVPVVGAVADGRLSTANNGATRVASSRSVRAGTSIIVDLGAAVPVGAEAAVVSLIVDHTSAGSVTAYPSDARVPLSWSVVTDTKGQTRANTAIVRLASPHRNIRVFSSRGAHVTVDVLGWYSGASAPKSIAGLFVPTTVRRRLDQMTGRPIAPIGPVTFEFSTGTTAEVSAVVGNLLTAGMWDTGSVVAKPAGVPAGPAVVVSRVSTWPESVASQFIVRTSTRGVALSSAVGAYMVVDVTGWFLGARPVATRPPVANRSIAPSSVNAVRWTDSTGTHARTVKYRADDNLMAIVDQKIGGVNGVLGAVYRTLRTLQRAGNIMVFGHRTTGAGMFRHIETVKLGSTFSLRGTNGHWYNYRVVYVGVTPPRYSAISNITHYFPPVTAQLVACSLQNGQPTSLQWRITVTGRLVSVT